MPQALQFAVYHAFFSRDRWSSWALARRLARLVLAHFVPAGAVELAVDDTVTEHPGRKVYGKGCHRDPVRSTHSFTAYRWGHKWVALVVLVRVPWATRRWALPLLLALYRPKGQARRHKTPAQRARQMLRVLMRWFPERHFVCTGDSTYGTHQFARLAAACPAADDRQPVRRRCQLGGPTAALLGHGRPPVKGEDLPDPVAVVAATVKRSRAEVEWYGGGSAARRSGQRRRLLASQW